MKKRKKITEGHKMFFNVMGVFLIYTLIFLLFKNYEQNYLPPYNETDDIHLLIFCGSFMIGLAWIMYYYAKRMNKRISYEQRKKETLMRRELTQNISHELKTPVASILGFTETILDNPSMSEETKIQFVIRTNAQAQRLSSLLQDISMLNRMDYAANVLTIERINVSNVVSEIIQEIELDLNKKNMLSKNYLPENILIKGNTSMVYSIFRNLFENAINYAGNGTTIEIAANEHPDKWQFRFNDNGQGIPSEHLTRIFERFYRIDKGRSRALGGTGLGLAIIKNAIQLHGGNITVSSAEGGGLCFDFTLKKMIKSF
jgi:signal transduction histidine kinase